jgi:hypothetical protein
MIEDESQFIAIHNKIAPNPTHKQTQVASDTALSQLNDNDYQELQKTTLPNPTVTKKDKKNKFKRCLFLHYTHENRLKRLKHDIHKIYKTTFTDPTLNHVKLIVGTRNNPKAKTEFIRRKRPHDSLRRHDFKPRKYSYFITKLHYFH